MAEHKLSAVRRTVIGKQVNQLRRDGWLPAVLYGPGLDTTPIQINAREAARALRYVGGAELIELTLDGETREVLMQDVQRDSLRGTFKHVDFYAVDMTRTLQVNVPVRLVGTSAPVASQMGVLVRGIDQLLVECLPRDLITEVEADLGELKEVGSALHVRDLYVPKTITVLTDPDEVVARVTAAREEEMAEEETTPVSAEVEVIEKGKAEEEGEEEGE